MRITIPGRLPGLNEMIGAARQNRFGSAKQKQVNTELVAWWAKQAKIPKMQKASLAITWYEPNQKRDKDNIMAGQKFIWDGLVMAGVLSNDGWKQIGDITHRFRIDKYNPRVEVELIEVKAS